MSFDKEEMRIRYPKSDDEKYGKLFIIKDLAKRVTKLEEHSKGVLDSAIEGDRRIKEVLRKLNHLTYNLCVALLEKNPILKKLTIKQGLWELLEKLDSQGKTDCIIHEWVNTVGNQIRCDKCDRLKTEKKICFMGDCTLLYSDENPCEDDEAQKGVFGRCHEFKKKASEGEKPKDNVHGSRAGESVRTSLVATNSKPPEPIRWCDTCEDRLTCAYYIAGEDCRKPREDDSIKRILMGVVNKFNKIIKGENMDFVVVHREKIEFWRKEMLNQTENVLKSMREVLEEEK